MDINKAEMEHKEDSYWDIRPKDDGWTNYRIINASQSPEEAESFLSWPFDEAGDKEFVTLDDSEVIELRHEDGRQIMYAHRRYTFQIQLESRYKGKSMRHVIRVKNLSFRVHRRRIWLEDRIGFRYYIGALTSGETVYLTESLGKYTLGMDEVCRALAARP